MSFQLSCSSLIEDKFFVGAKITELKFADWTLNFAISAELNTSNEQIFAEIAELNVVQCKYKDFSIHSLTCKNDIPKISRFRAIRFVRQRSQICSVSVILG